jgi:hypothetical protein
MMSMDTDSTGRGTSSQRRVLATILLFEMGAAWSPIRRHRERGGFAAVDGKSMIAALDTEAARG